MASSNSPCAACKFLRRKCTQECVFAPYFPPDQPEKFANVHKVFGASNVAKLLNDLPSVQREDAVNSLAYEARMRLHDPVYGCVGIISVLQQRLKVVQHELYNARKELASYVGPSAMHPLVVPNANHHPQAQMLHPHHLLQNNASSSMGGAVFGGGPMVGLEMPPGASAQQQQAARIQQQQMLEAQQMAALREQQELMRSYEQQQQELVRYNSNSPFVGEGNHNGSSAGFNHMSGGMPSNLALVPVDNQFPIQQQQHQQPELLQHHHHHHHQEEEHQHQHQQQQQQSVIKNDGNGNNEGGGGGTSVVGPSS